MLRRDCVGTDPLSHVARIVDRHGPVRVFPACTPRFDRDVDTSRRPRAFPLPLEDPARRLVHHKNRTGSEIAHCVLYRETELKNGARARRRGYSLT